MADADPAVVESVRAQEQLPRCPANRRNRAVEAGSCSPGSLFDEQDVVVAVTGEVAEFELEAVRAPHCECRNPVGEDASPPVTRPLPNRGPIVRLVSFATRDWSPPRHDDLRPDSGSGSEATALDHLGSSRDKRVDSFLARSGFFRLSPARHECSANDS